MSYVPNPDNFIGPAQRQPVTPPAGFIGPVLPATQKTYVSNATSGARQPATPSSSPGANLGAQTQQSYSPQPQQQQSQNSGGTISRDYALHMGWDVNNLPGGYQIEQPPQPSVEELANQEYNNTMNYLNGVEGWMRTQYNDANTATQNAANTNTESVKKSADLYKQEQQVNKDKAYKQKEDALSAARRLYDEMQMATRQRFGGATSAGEAASELLGAEQMRQQGQAQNQYGEYVQQSDMAAAKVQQGITDALASIAQNAETARKTALSEFTAKMLEIAQKKGEAETLKNQRKLEALYQLRNQQFQINMQEKQFQQQIETERMKNEANVNTQRSNEMGAFAVLGSKMQLKPQTQYKIGQTTFTTTSAPLWVGQIQKFVVGDDEQGRTVYWDPALQNFDFGYSKYDAGGNPVTPPQQ